MDSTAGDAPKREPEVSREMNRLTSAIEKAQERTVQIQQRLSGVLSKSEPAKEGIALPPSTGATTDLGALIHGLGDRVDVMSATMGDTLARLEV